MESLCGGMYCSIPNDPMASCRTIVPQEFTPCGLNKVERILYKSLEMSSGGFSVVLGVCDYCQVTITDKYILCSRVKLVGDHYIYVCYKEVLSLRLCM